ncbi:MAG TPA: DUF2203 domain-containing protein [Actinomycetota bacterium]|nr:DUF2203 domain-containing protein [Actinomycetota bacterium]
MTEKSYTLEEANALLPYLAPALVELRERYEEAASIRATVGAAAASNGWSDEREAWSRTLARVDELIERFLAWNVELRDVSTGLVDFPTVIQGQDAYLCWRLGEPEVAYWHFAGDGFAGRTPL